MRWPGRHTPLCVANQKSNHCTQHEGQDTQHVPTPRLLRMTRAGANLRRACSPQPHHTPPARSDACSLVACTFIKRRLMLIGYDIKKIPSSFLLRHKHLMSSEIMCVPQPITQASNAHALFLEPGLPRAQCASRCNPSGSKWSLAGRDPGQSVKQARHRHQGGRRPLRGRPAW